MDLNTRSIHVEELDEVFYRQYVGIGDLLAEGSARAAKKIGGGAEKYALTVKGSEMVAFEPRPQTNLALGYGTCPIGPHYEVCEYDWDLDPRAGWPHTLNYCRTIGIRERIHMEFLGHKKVHNYKALSILWSVMDAPEPFQAVQLPRRVGQG